MKQENIIKTLDAKFMQNAFVCDCSNKKKCCKKYKKKGVHCKKCPKE
jgi:hypothetical protein